MISSRQIDVMTYSGLVAQNLTHKTSAYRNSSTTKFYIHGLHLTIRGLFKYFRGPWILKTEFNHLIIHFRAVLKHAMNPVTNNCL